MLNVKYAVDKEPIFEYNNINKICKRFHFLNNGDTSL